MALDLVDQIKHDLHAAFEDLLRNHWLDLGPGKKLSFESSLDDKFELRYHDQKIQMYWVFFTGGAMNAMRLSNLEIEVRNLP